MDSSQISKVIQYVKNNSPFLEHNKKLFDILEGDLLKYILSDLKEQLSPEAFEQIQYRVSPINIFKRIIFKTSQIYNKAPQRIIIDGGKNDEELLDFYIKEMKLDQQMGNANSLFNTHKCVTVEPFIENMLPRIRSIPADRNIFYSDNKVNPLTPTLWVKFMGQKDDKNIYFIYTDTEFIPVDENGVIQTDILAMNENPSGINPYGKIPSVYINRSYYSLLPVVDTDTFKMIKALPIILSDLAYCIMYQSFSILWGIDVKIDNLVKAPNSFWSFSSDPTSDKKPEIGVLKPEVDIDQVLNFIKTELVLWLNSRNIRPGSVGDLNAENVASGISKIVDESDTVEDRQSQIPFFVNAEAQLFDLIINHLHPYWKATGQIDQRLDWTPGVKVQTIFPEQLPLIKRGEIVDVTIKEMQAGLITKKLAVKRLNPEMTDKEIDLLLAEINQQQTIEIMEEQDGMQSEEADEEKADNKKEVEAE